VYPFLAVSGTIYVISNYKEAEKAADDPSQVSPDKIGVHIAEALPSALRAVRRALGSSSDPVRQDSDFDDHRGEAGFEEPTETLQGLIEDLFAPTVTTTVAAAWRLAALMDSSNVQVALEGLELTEDQLNQPRLRWLVRPSDGSVLSDGSLNVVQGRIGYLIRENGLKYLPPPPLAVDPSIAVALIAVREHGVAYHSDCLFKSHDDGDADTIELLYHAEREEADLNGRSSDVDSPTNQNLDYWTIR
jgi:hypothetical protein